MTFCPRMDWDFFHQNLNKPLNYRTCFSEHFFLDTFLLLVVAIVVVVVAAVFWTCKRNLLKSQQVLDHSSILCWVLEKKQTVECFFWKEEPGLLKINEKAPIDSAKTSISNDRYFLFSSKFLFKSQEINTYLCLPALSSPTCAADRSLHAVKNFGYFYLIACLHVVQGNIFFNGKKNQNQQNSNGGIVYEYIISYSTICRMPILW